MEMARVETVVNWAVQLIALFFSDSLSQRFFNKFLFYFFSKIQFLLEFVRFSVSDIICWLASSSSPALLLLYLYWRQRDEKGLNSVARNERNTFKKKKRNEAAATPSPPPPWHRNLTWKNYKLVENINCTIFSSLLSYCFYNSGCLYYVIITVPGLGHLWYKVLFFSLPQFRIEKKSNPKNKKNNPQKWENPKNREIWLIPPGLTKHLLFPLINILTLFFN